MKTYKPYYKDSDRLIVLDENMKVVPIEKVFRKVFGYVCLFGLTVYGLIGGVTSKFMMNKLTDLDAWADNPSNKELLLYTGVGFLMICLLTFVLYWIYKALSK